LETSSAERETDLTRREVVEGLLRRHRLRPEKRLGQNFLIDREALEKVVAAAELSPDASVLEVGAGLGTLTRRLSLAAGRVVAVEYDRRLEPVLQETVGSEDGVEIVIGDILRIDLGRLMGPAAYHVVANIPYQITSHLIRRLLEADAPPSRIVLTVQREVAERVLAAPGDMNLLALGVQAYGDARLMARLAASSFYPSPRVDSAVLRIDLRQPARLTPDQSRSIFRLARAGFAQPRKKLRNSLGAGLHLSPGEVEGRLRRLGVSPDDRAENLGLEDWERLAAGWDREAPP
jgi:16S rRNA (adenine1518-N6/adenine1519-N6)-dimethyltransferase